MNKTAKVLLIIILVLILVVIVVGIITLLLKGGEVKNITNNVTNNEKVQSNKYYMVYVDSGNGGATYYGQIAREDGQVLVLKDPGYINVQQPQEEGAQPQVNFTLMKDEFFKPISEMTIYKQSIVFIQQLTDESPIVDYYKNQVEK
jgi:hypothetical protein